MISLKKNNRDTMIYRDILIIYLKRFINSFDLDKDVLEDLIFDFNFANELSFFLRCIKSIHFSNSYFMFLPLYGV